MNYRPYKERTIDPTKPVEVYRCLNRRGRTFSIRQEGLVVGHTEKHLEFCLHRCEFVVQESGKIRCIEEQQRNVHAFVRGMVTNENISNTKAVRVSYNPYSLKGFHTENGEVSGALFAKFTTNGVFCIAENYKDV